MSRPGSSGRVKCRAHEEGQNLSTLAVFALPACESASVAHLVGDCTPMGRTLCTLVWSPWSMDIDMEVGAVAVDNDVTALLDTVFTRFNANA